MSVAYYGPFTGVYRETIVEIIINKLKDLEIKIEDNYNF